MLTSIWIRAAAALTVVWCVSASSVAPNVVLNARDLDSIGAYGLVMLPDGQVLHMAQVQVSALTQVAAPGDTLIYDVASKAMTVRMNTSPSVVMLQEPIRPDPLVASPFGIFSVARNVSLFDSRDSYFFPSLSNYPYDATELDMTRQPIFVGDFTDRYRSYQTGETPFQEDVDRDLVPNRADNCTFVANGALDTQTAGPAQYDTDSDGFGNRCDADFNGDCVVNATDLGLLRTRFFDTGVLNQDLNGDQVVNVEDLGLLRLMFFMPPGPSDIGACAQ